MTAATKGKLIVTLVADRVTKGAVRFTENVPDFPLNLYLRKDQVSDLGVEIAEGSKIKVEITAA